MEVMSGLGVIGFIFLFLLAVLWFLLPFAVFGIKDRLTSQLAEMKKTNAELARIAALLSAQKP